MKSFCQKITKGNGFTLIELMIVVAIIGILSAIIIPQYQRFTSKSKRIEGLTTLRSLHVAEISYFSTNNEFAFSDPAMANKGIPPNLGFSVSGAGKYYDLTSTGANAIQVNQGVPGNLATYRAIVAGNIDNDVTLDTLCIYYPTHSQFGCPITEIQPGVPGIFFSFLDDLNY